MKGKYKFNKFFTFLSLIFLNIASTIFMAVILAITICSVKPNPDLTDICADNLLKFGVHPGKKGFNILCQ